MSSKKRRLKRKLTTMHRMDATYYRMCVLKPIEPARRRAFAQTLCHVAFKIGHKYGLRAIAANLSVRG